MNLQSLGQDLKFAVRSLRRSPGFTVVTVLTLALGIGASVAMFGVLNGVLLRGLPVPEEDDLIVLWTDAPAGAYDHLPVFQEELAAFREQTRAFEAVGGIAYQGAAEQVLRDGDTPFTAIGTWVTGDFFPVLGITPVHGRTLLSSDDVLGAEPVMVIGYGFWQRHFGGDPSAVGRVLEWNGKRYTVVGVLPRGLEFPAGAEFWIPVFAAFPDEAQLSRSGYVFYDLVGRLRPGATVQEAREEFEGFLRETDSERVLGRGMSAVLIPLSEFISGEARATLHAAAAAVGLLLLIACINVANLLLIRGSARIQELAIRGALGAGRVRLVRQLLTESSVLALLGGMLGVLIAFVIVRVLAATAPPELPRREMIEIDARVLLVAVAITTAAALLSGMLPAVLSASGSLSTWLRSSGRTASANRGANALRHGLVIVQVSLAILVVVSAGLLVRSLISLQRVDVGFNEDQLMVFETSLPPDLFPERPQQIALREEMLGRVRGIPGVRRATSLAVGPFSGGGWTSTFSAEGQTAEAKATNPLVNLESSGPEYFRTMEIPLFRGRPFGAQDREDAPGVIIVSDALARHAWPDEDPIGKRVETPAEWLTVVGVAGETRYRDLMNQQPTVYRPTAQFGPMPMSIAVRTRMDPSELIPQVRLALQEVHPDWMVVRGGSIHQLLSAPLARPRFSALLLGSFAGMTLLLATVGIYGVMAASVRQRTREIGIRLALGAQVEEVRTLVMRQGMQIALFGSAIGIALALSATRVLRSMMFEISPTDPVTFVVVTAGTLGAAALASYVPARRASRVNPLDAVRAE
ncbi:MAG: FtsX-like permease family protein [Gemmatimonas sp.]|nr:FtsX-like permease family protein [Gemmatimonas sp.]